MTDFFPFRIRCSREHGGGYTPLRNQFHSVRPDDMTWYGYDVVVQSPYHVMFVVFEMEDNVYGGVGREIAELACAVEPGLLKEEIVGRAKYLAKDRRRRQLEEAEQAIITSLTIRILAENSLIDAEL